ncbi:hypothetical protein MED121_23805 [Marinomonas sp. MED121]|uniref:delta-class carbonic anhydrase n=1 Tax=Marinomonas sp. MED121 TaxID=314277 RepID=UPI000068FE1B|nr:delta-class carbonic anhydrase [Marinomonas sp. MED121]EAQ63401.1 hypothetical protein MED121_23805 [Marinomonas sp. MED121]
MKNTFLLSLVATSLIPLAANASSASSDAVSDSVIAEQRAMLEANTSDKGYGPQSPRDLNSLTGNNEIVFGMSPDSKQMNLCNIHFHKNAEHKGGEFTQFAGNGDGHGYHSGYKYTGSFTKDELKPYDHKVGESEHGALYPGDTIEVHYVYSSAKVTPGPTLGSCLTKENGNPQLRVETQVYALVNDKTAQSFLYLTAVKSQNDRPQAPNIPANTGKPISYIGSTTGPGYNEKASPYQVTWNVRPQVVKVNIATVDEWLKDNVFDEDHAHGVRNLVTNLNLLSKISN